MLETLVALLALVLRILGGEWMGILRAAIQVLLWGQIITAVVMLLVKLGFWALLSLGGGVGGAMEADKMRVSEGVGALLGFGVVGAVGLWNIFMFLIRKGLLIAGCLLILTSANLATTIGGLLYGFALLWSWQNDWGIVKAFFAGAKQGLES